MGRSENSRNRIFVKDNDTVKTVPFDETKAEDPSLIIYNALRVVAFGDTVYHIVSNGDQTDTIADYLSIGDVFENAVSSREFEPDAPNYTSRISGLLTNKGSEAFMGICRRDPSTGEAKYDTFTQDLQANGMGACIHTYESDGNPLPAFMGGPRISPLDKDVESTAHMYWDALDNENRIAVVVKSIDVQTGDTDFYIINRLES